MNAHSQQNVPSQTTVPPTSFNHTLSCPGVGTKIGLSCHRCGSGYGGSRWGVWVVGVLSVDAGRGQCLSGVEVRDLCLDAAQNRRHAVQALR
jgi:hypothetical protein